MKIKKGNEVKRKVGEVYMVVKIEKDMGVMKSKDGDRQIMIGVDPLQRLYGMKTKESKDNGRHFNTSLSNHRQIFSKKSKNIHLRKTNGRIRNGYVFLCTFLNRQLPNYPSTQDK